MKILVVDDSPSTRAFIGGTVERAFGADVTETGTGFEALRVLPGRSFDAIIADVNMPDINGLELLRYLKAHPAYARIPVIIISTQMAPADQERGMQAGASAYLTKPLQPQALEETLRTLITDGA